MKSKREFILETLLPYKNDPSTCAIEEETGSCFYLDKIGRKCPIGKHLKNPTIEMGGDVYDLNEEFGLKNILTDEAVNMDLDLDTWLYIQNFHDNLLNEDTGAGYLNNAIRIIESKEGIKLPELYS